MWPKATLPGVASRESPMETYRMQRMRTEELEVKVGDEGKGWVGVLQRRRFSWSGMEGIFDDELQVYVLQGLGRGGWTTSIERRCRLATLNNCNGSSKSAWQGICRVGCYLRRDGGHQRWFHVRDGLMVWYTEWRLMRDMAREWEDYEQRIWEKDLEDK